jgi:hypothetical protein
MPIDGGIAATDDDGAASDVEARLGPLRWWWWWWWFGLVKWRW